VTVVHILAASYVSQSAIQAGSAATDASERKTANYSNLSSSHVFYPVAMETLGALADDALVFLAEIGRRATLSITDPRLCGFYHPAVIQTLLVALACIHCMLSILLYT